MDAGATYTFGFDVWLVKVVFSPDVKEAHNQTRELIAIRDVNGDGVPDVVTINGSFFGGVPSLDPSTLKTNIYYNPEANYHLLTGIENPSGSRLVLRHGLYGNSGPELGRPIWALTAVARYDGYQPQGSTLPPHGQDMALFTTFDYRNGYYNRAERKFLWLC